MSKRIEYFCNLCREQIHNYAKAEQQDGKRAGFGYYFLGESIILKHLNETENHTCEPCLKMLREAK
jgi:hypothetical protein